MKKAAWLFVFAGFWVFFCTCGPDRPDATEISNDDPENPILAKIGDVIIDREYFEASLALLPPALYDRYSIPLHFREFLDELVIQEIYYLEGKRRFYDKKPDYLNLRDRAKRAALTEYVLEKEVQKTAPVTDQDVRTAYDANPEDYRDTDKGQLTFDQTRRMVRHRLERARKEQMFHQVGQTLKKRFSVRFNFEGLKLGNERSLTPVVESGIMTWTFLDFVVKARDAGYKQSLKDFEGRKRILNQMVLERLFHDNSLADEVDREKAFLDRVEVLSHFILASYTKNKVVGSDIEATSEQVKAYYELHPELFTNASGERIAFDIVKPKVKELATAHQRAQALSELSYAISRDRFLPVVYEQHCARLWANETLASPSE